MSKQIGALLRENGCEFRIWCPHAEAVWVLLQTGTHWDHDSQTQKPFELLQSSDGYWTGFVAGVEAGRLYRYQITNEGRTFEQLDSAARDTIHSQTIPMGFSRTISKGDGRRFFAARTPSTVGGMELAMPTTSRIRNRMAVFISIYLSGVVVLFRLQ